MSPRIRPPATDKLLRLTACLLSLALIGPCAALGAAGAGLPRFEKQSPDEFNRALRDNAHFFGMLVSFSYTAAIAGPAWGQDAGDINLNLISRAVRDERGRQIVRVRVAGVVRKNHNVELNVLNERGEIVGKGFLGYASGQLSFFDAGGKTIIDGFMDSRGNFELNDRRLPEGKQILADGIAGDCFGCGAMNYAWFDGLNVQVGGGGIFVSSLPNGIRIYWSFEAGTLGSGGPAYGEAEYDMTGQTTGAINSSLFDTARTAASFFANPYSLVAEPVGKAYLPRFTDNTGVAVTNPSKREVRVTYIARAFNGAILAGDGIENPATYTFAPGQQFAAYPFEIFRGLNEKDRRPVLQPNETGWMEIFSDDGDIQAVFLDGPADGWSLAGNIGAELGRGTIVFPDLRLKFGESTEIELLNLTYEDVMVRLELLDREGRTLVADPEHFIAGYGMRKFYLGPGSDYLRPADFSQAAGLRVSCNNSNSIRSTGCARLIGLATFTDRFGSVSNAYAVDADSAGHVLVAPYFVAGSSGDGAWETVVRVAKLEGVNAPVSLDAYDVQGNRILTLEQNVLPGGNAVFVLDSAALPHGGTLWRGYVRLRAGADNIAGSISVAWSNGSRSLTSTYPLANYLSPDFHFNQVAQGSAGGIDYWTGVSLMNDLNKPVRVSLEIVRPDGVMDRAVDLTLPPYGQYAGLLSELLRNPSYTRLDGYLRIAASDPISAIVLYGDSLSRFLTAVPGIPR